MHWSTFLSLAAAAISVPATLADDKYVFAHFIAGNAAGMTSSDWSADISAAQTAGLDGFAMNIAAEDTNTDSVLAAAYSAAETAGNFSLFLSFDYLSEGTWAASDVISKINEYKDSSAQFYYNDKVFVSTFEGVDNTGDWSSIKSETDCFFMPDWSSLGASTVAAESSIDGAFAWAAWPDGPNDMTTETDEEYISALGDKPYMMAVSPWFYTNLPAWSKNWVWRGDDLWHDRWQQAIELQPAIVEVLTWNDYGESHYIGPIHESGIPSGADYVSGMSHGGWRTMLPHYIEAYKSGNTTVSTASADSDPEKISYWYKLTPSTVGSTDGTTGNDASDGQTVYSPTEVSQDMIFATVLVSEASDVSIQVGSNSATSFKAMTAGINHFSTSMNSQTGNVTITVSRNGNQILQTTGPEITDSTSTGNVNFNAYAGSSEDLS